MSATRQLRAFTSSCRALSSRNVASRCASPIRSGFTPRQVSRVAPSTLSTSWGARAFSLSAPARDGDRTLSQKLEEEIKYEKEITSVEGTPEWLTAFQDEGIWTIETQPGSDEITLLRTFGNEQIRLMFTIADIDSNPPESLMESEEQETPEEEQEIPTYPIRTAITVTKSGSKGALSIDAICQDGLFTLENIAFYADAKLGTELSADADWKRRGLYMGPQFEHLDVNVQEEFEAYLRERGISEGLALFIPEYAEFKEQQEYVRWLESVKGFVDA
ncbi:hypothetical protein M422DRAFT_38655 [Sphaerobolus stellatus SS14]|uniref:Mitochondrial acidic protein MAM33 n=1 Tax=Sphaerobolus stellatus (strain SS14) TaxID=990650 RepID=A0A0C9UJD8_SPHS4|nr:hypothetical protein M422DRAFT_38655 [Sphaerobolus stellatus SS14]